MSDWQALNDYLSSVLVTGRRNISHVDSAQHHRSCAQVSFSLFRIDLFNRHSSKELFIYIQTERERESEWEKERGIWTFRTELKWTRRRICCFSELNYYSHRNRPDDNWWNNCDAKHDERRDESLDHRWEDSAKGWRNARSIESVQSYREQIVSDRITIHDLL